MHRTLVVAFALCVWAAGTAALAQDCIFQTGANDSFKKAMSSFHDVMSGLVHGAAGKGDVAEVRTKAADLARLRDGIMASALPVNLGKRCPEISIKARELSRAVDSLVAQCKADAGNDKVKAAFDGVHTAYRDLNSALTSLEELLEGFHEVMHPLWHDAYPKKDAAAIKAEAPKLKVRAKLILSTAQNIDKGKVAGAQKLLDAVTTLEEASAANDDASILEALRLVHEVYEKLAEG